MEPSPDLVYREYPILVVDDEPDILSSFRLAFRREFTVHCAEGGLAGLEVLKQEPIAVVVADQRMPEMSGLEFLQKTMDVRPDLIRIILTGYTDIDTLVEAINSSRIYRYVTKPWDPKELQMTLRRGIEAFRLERENQRLVTELARANEQLSGENAYLRDRDAREYPRGLVGSSGPMTKMYGLLDKIADSPTTVLILGETGTGKELIARSLHERSPRSKKLFVAVNCAALTESLLESELFGHKRGAFTGAGNDKKGLFEVANGGTLFLDEIGETTPAMQAKLLRVLQEGEITPVGETRPRKIDTRIVAATNRNLEAEVAQGRFREDLYYRLRVVPVRVPPLRERPEDIADLVDHFIDKHAARLGKRVAGIEPGAMSVLTNYPYPGNVRELENEMERAVLLSDPGEPIAAASLSEFFLSDPPLAPTGGSGPAPSLGESGHGGEEGDLRERTDAFERKEIQATLERSEGKKARAARELGITYQGLLKKMRRLGMME